MLLYLNNCSGTIWFDDVTLEKNWLTHFTEKSRKKTQ